MPDASRNQTPPKQPTPTPKRGSRISNTEWGLVIGAALVIDLIELGLALLVIGLVLNELIDVVVGMALPIYFKIRGVKVNNKRLATWCVAYVLEAITDGFLIVGWTIDVVITMLTVKAEEKLAKLHI